MRAHSESAFRKAIAGAIGAAIKRERLRLGWTGTDTRKHSGVDPTSLSMFERGERIPLVPVLYRLAGALGVPPAALLGPIGSAPRPRSEASPQNDTHRKSTKRVLNGRQAANSAGISTRRRATR